LSRFYRLMAPTLDTVNSVAPLTLLRSVDSHPHGLGLDVVERAQNGNKTAQRLLYLHFAPTLVRVVQNSVRDMDLTKDIVQETFVTAFVNLNQLKQPEALKSWLIQIALSYTRKHFRKEKLKSFLGFSRMETDEQGILVPNHLHLESKAQLAGVLKQVAQLNLNERNAFTLRYIEEFSLPEVAQSLDVSLATAKRYIAKAEAELNYKNGGDHASA
jgi:RNA polymerase sigma-70 factor, ECF subfamily